MGSQIDVRCTACGFSGSQISWGSGMLWSWDFFEYRLYACETCESLESAYVARPLRELRSAVAGEGRTDWPGPFQLTRQELATLVLDARQYPQCSVCEGQLHGRPARGEELPTRCPNCSGRLEASHSEGGVLWD